ncbi:hypothetical protein KZZ52_24745 [Dactylosporangium sp. AC04546]|uniref:hypothetical protein n=1 Tax=Dactylosporangium sp. AC04546 TaxID=2862460 RepID=UPI001EDECF46|nr:hypothetical protein [Dactylosporangium sp. AC04546]WVK88483.1 hypothetical protein KZZ52_24745 [Dactylosporangium sp. AC04546]
MIGPERRPRAGEVLTERYRLLLLAYPFEYRERRGEELLGTLIDDASPEQRWPSGREAASIVVQGLRERLGAARCHTPGAVWSEGLQMGALLLLGYAFAGLVSDLIRGDVRPVQTGIAVLLALSAIVATMRSRWIVALVLAAAWLTVLLQYQWLSWPLGTAVVALAALAVGFRSVRQPRSAGWLLVAPVAVAVQYMPVLFALAVVAGFLLTCLIGVALDTRIPIAAACLLVAVALQNTVGFRAFDDTHGTGTQFVVHPIPASYVLLAMVAALFLAGHIRSRQLARL